MTVCLGDVGVVVVGGGDDVRRADDGLEARGSRGGLALRDALESSVTQETGFPF